MTIMAREKKDLPVRLFQYIRKAWISDEKSKQVSSDAYWMFRDYDIEVWLYYGLDIRFFDDYTICILHPTPVVIKTFGFRRPSKEECNPK